MKNQRNKVNESLDNVRWKVQTINCVSHIVGESTFEVDMIGFWNGPVPVCTGGELISYIEAKLNPQEVGLHIKNVVFNEPATIVFWTDGTKTVVKTQNGEEFDPEKGLAMAIAKKVFGNKGSYFDEIKKWLPKEESSSETFDNPLDGLNISADTAKKVMAAVFKDNHTCANCKFFHRGVNTCHEGERDGIAPKLTVRDNSCDKWEGLT